MGQVIEGIIAGKSNLMDAISFVLGIKSNQLRSAQIKELIYHDGKEFLDTCSVGLVYQEEDMTTIFSRRSDFY